MDGEPALKELTAPEPDSTEAESSSQQAAVPTGEENRKEEKPVQEKAEDTTAEAVMEEMRSESQENIQPPEPLARVLSQESDGQIRLVVPESESIEKQITGQMSIEDILTEWERMKRENEQKRKEEVRQHVLQQTGAMFTEFEAAVRDGLLEKLEKDAAAKNQKPAEAVVPDSEDTDDLEAEVEEIAFEAEEAEDLSDAAEQEAAGEEAGADGAEIVEDGEFEELEEVEEPVLEEEPFEEEAAVEEIEEIPGGIHRRVSEPEETPEAVRRAGRSCKKSGRVYRTGNAGGSGSRRSIRRVCRSGSIGGSGRRGRTRRIRRAGNGRRGSIRRVYWAGNAGEGSRRGST